jgi:hypothetical protein
MVVAVVSMAGLLVEVSLIVGLGRRGTCPYEVTADLVDGSPQWRSRA